MVLGEGREEEEGNNPSFWRSSPIIGSLLFPVINSMVPDFSSQISCGHTYTHNKLLIKKPKMKKKTKTNPFTKTVHVLKNNNNPLPPSF